MKKACLILLVAILLISLFAGCTAKSTTANQTDTVGEETTITMWTFLDPTKTTGREVVLAKLIDDYYAQTGVKVVVEPQAWDTLTAKFLAAHATGSAPDLIWVNSEDMGSVLNANALEPLENLFVADWDQQMLDDISDSFWDYASRNGEHYQIGFSRNYVGVVYRKDLLEQAGYSVPFKNWDDFCEAAAQLTVEFDEITQTKRYGFGTPFSTKSSNPIIISNMLLKEYGTMFNADGTANWANETGVAAVDLLQRMMDDGSIPQDAISTGIDSLCTDFSAGKYAMITGPSTRISSMKANAVFDPDTVSIMPYPSDEEGVYSPAAITGWCVGVWSGSKNKQEAGKFLEYMASPEADQMWVVTGGQVPMRRSTLTACKEFLEMPENQYIMDAYTCLTQAAWANPTEFTVTGWRDDQAQVMQDVLVNGADAMTALREAETTFNERNGR